MGCLLVSGERGGLQEGKWKDELVSFLTDSCAYTLYIYRKLRDAMP